MRTPAGAGLGLGAGAGDAGVLFPGLRVHVGAGGGAGCLMSGGFPRLLPPGLCQVDGGGGSLCCHAACFLPHASPELSFTPHMCKNLQLGLLQVPLLKRMQIFLSPLTVTRSAVLCAVVDWACLRASLRTPLGPLPPFPSHYNIIGKGRTL